MNHIDTEIIETLASTALRLIEESKAQTDKKLRQTMYDAAMRCLVHIHKIFDSYDSPNREPMEEDIPTTMISQTDAEYIQGTLSLLNNMIYAREGHSIDSNRRYKNTRDILNKYLNNIIPQTSTSISIEHDPNIKVSHRVPADTLRIAGVNFRIDKDGKILFKDYYNEADDCDQQLDESIRDYKKQAEIQKETMFTDDLYELNLE